MQASISIRGRNALNSAMPDASQDGQLARVEADLNRLLDAVVAADFLGCLLLHRGTRLPPGRGLDRRYSEPAGPGRITVTAAGRSDSLLQELPEEFDAFTLRKEVASELPGTRSCWPVRPPARFRFGSNVYAIRFHP
jgi:GMP synthase (glutamine-hydrolysing)